MTMAAVHSRERGLSLVELLTVMAIITLLATWFVGALAESVRDTRIRAVIDQARQNLMLLELMRRSHEMPAGNSYNWSDLVEYIGELDTRFMADFVNGMEPVVFDERANERILIEEPVFRIGENHSSIVLTFTWEDVRNVNIPSARKSENQANNRTVFELFSRDADPLVFSYVADSGYMKQRLGY